MAPFTFTRLAVVLMSLTHLEDGFRDLFHYEREVKMIETNCKWGETTLSVAEAGAYMAWSLAVQLCGGAYLIYAALMRPASLAYPARAAFVRTETLGPRYAALLLLAFVISFVHVYGKLPDSMHAEGKTVFLMRNAGVAGGLLQLISSTLPPSGKLRPWTRLAARLLLAAHGLQLAPLKHMRSTVALWGCPGCDVLALPFAISLALGYRVRLSATLLAAMQLLVICVVDLRLFTNLVDSFSHSYIRYFVFEDLSTLGGIALCALCEAEPRDIGIEVVLRERRRAQGTGERGALLGGLEAEYDEEEVF